MRLLFFLISILSSTIGAISGIGGGVIIKPVLDATGALSVSTISFLSGCTVLSMSIVSFIRNKNNGVKFDIKKATFLASGAALGGVFGKEIFDIAKSSFENENLVGATQAILLLIITVGVLIYVKVKSKLKTYDVKNGLICFIIGLVLGLISAFLGIGGGPINIAVLYLFFSMEPKVAAKNSIYIILLSQITSLLSTLIKGTVPEFDILTLLFMMAGGIGGALIGSSISKKISSSKVEGVFISLLIIIIGVNIYNIFRFLY